MTRSHRFAIVLFTLALAIGTGLAAYAVVTRVDVSSRTPLANGKSWGLAGPYEKVVGTMHFAVDPTNEYDRAIVDLGLAPRDAAGKVEFSADFYVLRPVDAKKGSGAMLLEVPNRGGKAILALMDHGKFSTDPTTPAQLGDGFLMRQGATIAWIGWQWDVPHEDGRMSLDAPIAREPDGKAITGLVRSDFNVDDPEASHPLGHVIVDEMGGLGYPVANPQDPRNVLTERDAPDATRTVVPRSHWRFARVEKGKVVPDDRSVWIEGGFQPGKVYEVVYVAKNPVVAGVGFAAIRDAVSYFKHNPGSIAPVRYAYGLGISQCGRYLRMFVKQGFNADEEGREVFDGLFIHVAGAGIGSFNHRFAQPSRDAEVTSTLFYPTDLFPFTFLPETDPVTGRTAGLLDRARQEGVVPKIFTTNTSYEYWGRATSLVTTTADGKRDVTLPPELRVYFLAGLQHFSGPFPPKAEPFHGLRATHPENPNPMTWLWRALYVDMDQWVRHGTPPPASSYPKVADGGLVSRSALDYPKIPGLVPPKRVHLAHHLDYGPEWKNGIITKEPPIVGAAFPSLVPRVDADGNDRGGVRIPEMQVPVATTTGWNLRDPATGFAGYRVSFIGSYDPFPATMAEREKTHDPRLSLAERYGSKDHYMTLFTQAALDEIHERFLLPGDLAAVLQRGSEEWNVAVAAKP